MKIYLPETFKGGHISNFYCYIPISFQFFGKNNSLEDIISSGILLKKIFIKYDIDEKINDTNIYIIPYDYGFDIFSEKYQIYIGKYTIINDDDQTVNINNFYGNLKLFKEINIGDDYIVLYKELREGNIKINDNLIDTPLIIYNKNNHEIIEENKIKTVVETTINNESVLVCFLYNNISKYIGNNNNIVSLGINIKNYYKYYPIWIGVNNFYNNNYEIRLNIVLSSRQKIDIIEII